MRGNRTLRLMGRLTADLDAAMYDWGDDEGPSDARPGAAASHGAEPVSGTAAMAGPMAGAARGPGRLAVPA